jgi:hypothetical protein
MPKTTMSTAEVELRELWTRIGVPQVRQDELIAEIDAKAQPGAKVGPFTIGEITKCDYCENIAAMTGRRHCPIHMEQPPFPELMVPKAKGNYVL